MHYDELSTDCVIFVSVKYVLDSVLRWLAEAFFQLKTSHYAECR